jgi:DNA-binding MarR family transcriptional regulator
VVAVTAPSPGGPSIRRLLHRRLLASNRHRAAVGQRLGLRPSELAALGHLAEHGALTPSELRSQLVLTSGGVTALLQRLERDGHVQRTPHPSDGRSCLLRAGPGIVQRAARMSAPLVVVLDAEIEALSAADRRVVSAFLTRVVAATEREADALLRTGGQPERAGDDADASGLWT